MQMRRNLARCHQNESTVAEYVHELQELFNMIGDISERDKVLKFWNGSRAIIQKGLWRDNLNPEISTWEQVVAQAEIIEISENVAERRDRRAGPPHPSGLGEGTSKSKNPFQTPGRSARAVTFDAPKRRHGHDRQRSRARTTPGSREGSVRETCVVSVRLFLPKTPRTTLSVCPSIPSRSTTSVLFPSKPIPSMIVFILATHPTTGMIHCMTTALLYRLPSTNDEATRFALTRDHTTNPISPNPLHHRSRLCRVLLSLTIHQPDPTVILEERSNLSVLTGYQLRQHTHLRFRSRVNPPAEAPLPKDRPRELLQKRIWLWLLPSNLSTPQKMILPTVGQSCISRLAWRAGVTSRINF